MLTEPALRYHCTFKDWRLGVSSASFPAHLLNSDWQGAGRGGARRRPRRRRREEVEEEGLSFLQWPIRGGGGATGVPSSPSLPRLLASPPPSSPFPRPPPLSSSSSSSFSSSSQAVVFCICFWSPEPELNKSRRLTGLLEFCRAWRRRDSVLSCLPPWLGRSGFLQQPTPFEITLARVGVGVAGVGGESLHCNPPAFLSFLGNTYLQKD